MVMSSLFMFLLILIRQSVLYGTFKVYTVLSNNLFMLRSLLIFLLHMFVLIAIVGDH